MENEQSTHKKVKAFKAVGDLFGYRWIIKNMSFFLFLAVIAVLYIANNHMADNRIRRINDTARRLKDLQYEYKTLKSEIMFRSRESEMIRAAAPLGLIKDTTAPYRINLMRAAPLQ